MKPKNLTMKQKLNTLLCACLLLLCGITTQQSQAQTYCTSTLTPNCELVCNGSFETVSATPSGLAQLTNATGWSQSSWGSHASTTDLFSTSSSVGSQANIPCNNFGYQLAHTGNHYAGMLTNGYQNSSNPFGWIEGMAINFSGTMQAGKIYEVSLWVSAGDLNNREVHNLLIDVGGVYTYTVSPTLLNDYTNWTLISFPYCALGFESSLDIHSTTNYTLTSLTPVTTGSCIYTSGDNGSYLYIDDVSVKEVIFTVPSQTVCASSTATLTATTPTNACAVNTANYTYNWNYGDGSTAVNTGTNITTTHSYTTYGTYTGSLTVSTGSCAITYTYNVHVPNVPITITTNTNTICNGTTNFTATPSPSGSYTYTWTVKDAATGTVIPTSNYTITAGTTATPAINFANINQNVNVCVSITSTLGCNYTECLYMPSCCATPTGATKYSNKTFTTTTTILNTASGAAFGGTITVNTGVTLQIVNTKVQMDPNTKFVINGTGKLNIINSYLYGCNSMWDGIYPIGTNTIVIRDCRIEDAQRVLIDSLGGAVITFTNNYINKNYQGIAFKAVKTSTSSVNVKGNLFTCSSIPTPTAQPWVPTALKPNLTNAPTFGGYSSVNLMLPYNTLKSYCGISMANASHTGQSNTAITIGATSNGTENVFDKIQYGACINGSNDVFQNNVFQNIKSSIAPVTGGANNAAVLVIGSPNGTGAYYSQIGGTSSAFKNTFKDNDFGVADVLQSALLITYNTFSTQTTGIYMNANNNGKTVNIRNNNFYQNNIGVNCYANTYVTTSIKDNNFDNTASAVGSYADNYAIYCAEATLATNPSTYPAFDIDNNKISGFYNGIYTSQTLLPIMYDNEVHMRSDNTTDHWQQGISAANTNSATINNNMVDMPSLNLWSYWQIGINLSTNQVPKAQCNSVNNVNMAIAAGGSNLTPANDGIKGNYLQNANFGIWLINNGEIGDQAGSSGSNSSDNAWNIPDVGIYPTYYTYAQNSSNQNSDIFFTRSGGGYDIPTAKAGVSDPAFSNIMSGNNSSAASTGSCNVNAATPSNAKLTGAASLAGLMQTAEDIAFDYNQATNFSLNASANLSAADDINDNEVNRKAIMRKQLLSNIVLQQVDVQDSKELTAFMAAVTAENTGLLFAVDSLIHDAEKDNTKITAAKNANATIAPNNKVEQSQQQFNELYLAYLAQNKSLNNSEVSNLETIATQCPMYYGTAVYQARAVLFDLKHQNYRSTCENVSPNASSKRIGQTTVNLAQTKDITVYPNPANTVVFIDAKNYETVVLKLYDVMGHLVIDKTVASTEKIDINNLSNGIYIYKLYHNDTELKVGKLIITH